MSIRSKFAAAALALLLCAGARADGIINGGGSSISLPVSIANGGTADTGSAWTAYTPTVSCAAGTLTTATAVGAFKTIGKTVFVTFTVTITTNGTCATYLQVSLPSTLNSAASLAAISDSNFNVIAYGTAGASTLFVLKYDGTYPGSSGHAITASGVYQST